MSKKIFILGAGITGLAAGHTTKYPILESKDMPGGIGWRAFISTAQAIRELGELCDFFRNNISGCARQGGHIGEMVHDPFQFKQFLMVE